MRYEATSTIKRRQPAGDALITVSVQIEVGAPGTCEFKSLLASTAVLEPTKECSSLHKSNEALLAACEGGALSGLIYSTRPIRDRCVAYLTELTGRNLPPDCGEGFAIAASLAAAKALGSGKSVSPTELKDWRQVSDS